MASTESNEGRACDAVIRRIETRLNSVRQNVSLPDQKNRNTSDVEFVCTIGNQTYAFEHTIIEPFFGHIRLQSEAPYQLQPVKDALTNFMPPGESLELHIHVGVLEGLKGKKLKATQENIVQWVKATSNTLPLSPYGSYKTSPNAANVEVEGIPFTVSLYRFKSEFYDMGFQIRHFFEGDLESVRLERIRKAYNNKKAKLAKWQKEGARSILILEDNDINLTNPQRVADALIQIEQNSNEQPDEIYLVGSYVKNLWFVHALRINDKGYYSLSNSNECLTEVNPAYLDNVTAKQVEIA